MATQRPLTVKGDLNLPQDAPKEGAVVGWLRDFVRMLASSFRLHTHLFPATLSGELKPKSYTIATLPAAPDAGSSAIIYVEDGAVGEKFRGSDGAAWRNLDGAGGGGGSPGPAGPAIFLVGEDGADGEPGPPGGRGVDGAAGAVGSMGPAVFLVAEDGAAGEPGPPGPAGVAGAFGATGAAGPPGPAIFLLSDAEAGEMGPPGPQGATGAPGVGGGGITTLKKTANQTINAGAGVFTDVTELTFPVTAGVDYAFHFYITFRSAAATTGWKAGVNHPGGTLDFWMNSDQIANGAAGVATHLTRHNTAVDDMTLLTATVTAGVDLAVVIEGRYQCTANGTFAARWANELAANTDMVIQKGSWGWYF